MTLKKEPNEENTDNEILNNEVLYEKDEFIVDVLGRSYIDNIIREGKVSKSIIILTNKRIYQKGKILSNIGDVKMIEGSTVVSLEDVTASTIKNNNPVYIIGYLLLAFILAAAISGGGEGLIGIVIPLSIVAVAAYFYLRERSLLIEYQGGKISTKIGWYTKRDVRKFRKNIYKQKSKYIYEK